MKIEVVRKWYTDKSTMGEIFIDSKRECFSLELPDLDNHPQTSCIREGDYSFSVYYSPHLGRWVILLLDVPGRSMIECHPANYPRELLGCIATGVTRGEDAVWSSGVAYDAFFDKILEAIKGAPHDPIHITIRKEVAA